LEKRGLIRLGLQTPAAIVGGVVGGVIYGIGGLGKGFGKGFQNTGHEVGIYYDSVKGMWRTAKANAREMHRESVARRAREKKAAREEAERKARDAKEEKERAERIAREAREAEQARLREDTIPLTSPSRESDVGLLPKPVEAREGI
jgi:hypothetical protein